MWDTDYISEVDYLYGYYAELSPARLKLALLSKGIKHSVSASPNYLELGFGQGLSLNINAAANSGKFYGTDFNPSQAAHARELSFASGKPVTIFDNSFEQLAQRSDLPEFDIIALHGIWSWVSDDSRKAIIDIISKTLKTGGILYISYNVTPGWSPAVPLRHLMSEYAKRSATGDIISRVEQSIDFVETVMDSHAAYFEKNPSLKTRLSQIKNMDKRYIAHEYFNTFWDPMPFSQIADMLSQAKMSFGASANILDNIETLSISAEAKNTLNKIKDPVLRETTKDYYVNQQFRRDIFVKGPRHLNTYELGENIMRKSFMRINGSAATPTSLKTPLGEMELIQKIYGPIFEAISSFKFELFTLGEIKAHKKSTDLTKWQIWEALLILTNLGYLAPVSETETETSDELASKALNRDICARAQFSQNMDFLAAPKIGTAIAVSHIEKLFILAQNNNAENVPEFVWKIFKSQNQKLVIAGKEINAEKDNLSHLKNLYSDFNKTKLPVLKATQAI